ncbi:MAG TPA: hypothetical protein VNO81_11315 [Candidatus Nitrosotenuis sp.]|jgi:hypothetical protein|nr:hypothetical protein [Candidatus Nitrosotenuis sp.]
MRHRLLDGYILLLLAIFTAQLEWQLFPKGWFLGIMAVLWVGYLWLTVYVFRRQPHDLPETPARRLGLAIPLILFVAYTLYRLLRAMQGP